MRCFFLLTAILPSLRYVLFKYPPTTVTPTLPYTRRRQIDSQNLAHFQPLFFTDLSYLRHKSTLRHIVHGFVSQFQFRGTFSATSTRTLLTYVLLLLKPRIDVLFVQNCLKGRQIGKQQKNYWTCDRRQLQCVTQDTIE